MEGNGKVEVKVCLSYVTKRSKHVSCMLPRCQSMSLVCYQGVRCHGDIVRRKLIMKPVEVVSFKHQTRASCKHWAGRDVPGSRVGLCAVVAKENSVFLLNTNL